jgi:hypothetical protein
MSDMNRASSDEVDVLVGKAWSQHYRGEHESAVAAFQDIVQRWPEHIDANYGLGLALRGAGQNQQSADVFRKTKSLIQNALTSQGEGNSRYMMLSRMVDQQLSFL